MVCLTGFHSKQRCVANIRTWICGVISQSSTNNGGRRQRAWMNVRWVQGSKRAIGANKQTFKNREDSTQNSHVLQINVYVDELCAVWCDQLSIPSACTFCVFGRTSHRQQRSGTEQFVIVCSYRSSRIIEQRNNSSQQLVGGEMFKRTTLHIFLKLHQAIVGVSRQRSIHD